MDNLLFFSEEEVEPEIEKSRDFKPVNFSHEDHLVPGEILWHQVERERFVQGSGI